MSNQSSEHIKLIDIRIKDFVADLLRETRDPGAIAALMISNSTEMSLVFCKEKDQLLVNLLGAIWGPINAHVKKRFEMDDASTPHTSTTH